MCPSDRRTFYRTGTIGVLDAGAARHLTVRLPASPATVVEASGHRAAVPLSEPILRTVAREISAIQLEAETFRPPLLTNWGCALRVVGYSSGSFVKEGIAAGTAIFQVQPKCWCIKARPPPSWPNNV